VGADRCARRQALAVTVETFTRAETDRSSGRTVAEKGIGKLTTLPEVIDELLVIEIETLRRVAAG
jgi:hypothetical protein